jgi:hypothetical protein
MSANRFSADDKNRLVVKLGKDHIEPDGDFRINKDNSLSYLLNEPQPWRRKYGLPRKINFQGRWKLDDNHDLELDLAQSHSGLSGGKITLKGEVICARGDILAFELRSQDPSGRKEFRVLELSGSWRADESNNIVFWVDKKGGADGLKFGSSWKLDEKHQITCTYDKTDLITGAREAKSVNFSGFWQIASDNILTYLFSTGSKSRFDFRAQIETPNLYPQEGKIKFRLGAGMKQGRPSPAKIVTFYGGWKFSRDLGLVFEMDYGGGRLRSWEFGADINLTRRDRIELSLVDPERKPLRVSVTFSHRFLKKLDAEAYLKFKALRDGPAIETGVEVPF